MNKRVLTLLVLFLSACLGWVISSTYVEREAVKDNLMYEDLTPKTLVETPIASTTDSTPAAPRPLVPATETPTTPVVKDIPKDKPMATCYVGGCSSQLCSDSPDLASTCEWRESYACYRDATCERQANGRCGWTETPVLTQCLNNANTSGEEKVYIEEM